MGVGIVVILVVVLCSIVKCGRCKPWLECCQDCCCAGCSRWLAAQSGTLGEGSVQSGSTVSSARSSTNSKRTRIPTKRVSKSSRTLPSPDTKSDSKAMKNESLVCWVCHLPDTDILTSCHHNFHYECLRVWYQTQSTCPACQQEILSHQSICVRCRQTSITVKLPPKAFCEGCSQ